MSVSLKPSAKMFLMSLGQCVAMRDAGIPVISDRRSGMQAAKFSRPAMPVQKLLMLAVVRACCVLRLFEDEVCGVSRVHRKRQQYSGRHENR